MLKDIERDLNPLPTSVSSYTLAMEVTNYSRIKELMIALIKGLYKM